MADQSLVKRFLWVSSRGWLAGGAALVLIGAAFAIHTALFLNHSVVTNGTIIDLKEVQGDESDSHTHAPVFRITAGDGTTYTITSHSSSNPPEFSIGEKVQVRYLVSDPAGAQIATFVQLWLMSVLLAAIGILLLLTGYVLHRNERRKRLTATANSELRTVD